MAVAEDPGDTLVGDTEDLGDLLDLQPIGAQGVHYGAAEPPRRGEQLGGGGA